MAESSIAVSTDDTIAGKQPSYAYCALYFKPRRTCRPFDSPWGHVMVDSELMIYMYAGDFNDEDFAIAISGAGRKGSGITFPEHTEVIAYMWKGKVAHIRPFYEVYFIIRRRPYKTTRSVPYVGPDEVL